MLSPLAALFRLFTRRPPPDFAEPDLSKYTRLLSSLLSLPPDGEGIPFGSFRPADIAFVVEALAEQRIRDLRLITDDHKLSWKIKQPVMERRFHTYEDFVLERKNKRPSKKDFIDYGASLERGKEDLESYIKHIYAHDKPFAEFLYRPHAAAINREAFETSVYITGETKSGKSYLTETLAYLLALEPNAGVWILDPHGQLARNCADWQANLDREVFYFDANIAKGQNVARFNPFDQLPDTTQETLDIVTQEQVNAFSVIAGSSAMSDNMRNLLASSIHLMLCLPNGSMQELFRLMDDDRNEDLVEKGTQLQNRFHREFFIHEFPKKTYNATKAAIATRLAGLLSSSILYNVTNGKSSFHIPTAFNRSGVYIFNFGKGLIGESASTMFGRLVLAQLQASAFKREKDGLTEKKVPTRNYVLIDECHNFVNNTTGTIVAEARKYGLSLILAQQYVGQGDIGTNLMRNILTNTPLKFTGVGTATTYEQIAAAQQADRESFYGLKPRLFHVSKRGSPPFIAAAAPFLATREARMDGEAWHAFIETQRARYYARTEATGVKVTSDTAPEVYRAQRAPEEPTEPIPPQPPPTPSGVLAAMRNKLTRKQPQTPSKEVRPTQPDASPISEDKEYLPEEELEKGVFYSRKKPKFPRP